MNIITTMTFMVTNKRPHRIAIIIKPAFRLPTTSPGTLVRASRFMRETHELGSPARSTRRWIASRFDPPGRTPKRCPSKVQGAGRRIPSRVPFSIALFPRETWHAHFLLPDRVCKQKGKYEQILLEHRAVRLIPRKTGTLTKWHSCVRQLVRRPVTFLMRGSVENIIAMRVAISTWLDGGVVEDGGAYGGLAQEGYTTGCLLCDKLKSRPLHILSYMRGFPYSEGTTTAGFEESPWPSLSSASTVQTRPALIFCDY